jgi:DNA-binding transcriptional LysR family regulator
LASVRDTPARWRVRPSPRCLIENPEIQYKRRKLQAALDGLGVAMGPTALVADDLATGRLVAPFPGVTLPTRGYHAYLPNARADDRSAICFCRWLEEIGGMDSIVRL